MCSNGSSWHKGLCFMLLFLSVLPLLSNAILTIDVDVSPLSNFTLPISSTENITYECSVTPGNQPEWIVDGFQLTSPSLDIAMNFAQAGIILEVLSSNATRLTITPRGRMIFIRGSSINTIICECQGIRGLQRGDTIVTVTVTTYAAPDPPRNLNLISIDKNLTLVWERPGNAPAGVSTTYTTRIFNVTDSGNVLLRENTSPLTSYSIHFLEEALEGMPCQRFQFTVAAENIAGEGSPAVFNETVPLSANTSAIDDTLRLVSLGLGVGENVTIIVEFRAVNSCSDNFPVLDYTINLNGQPALLVEASEVEPQTLERFVLDSNNITELRHNIFVELSVTVRSEVSERPSSGVLFQTTDIQSANVTFYQNNIFLTCNLANQTLSRGCVFKFSPNSNGTDEEEFILMRVGEETVLTQCNTTVNQRSAYTEGRISVFDIESDGSVSDFRIEPSDDEESVANFTMATGCRLQDPPTPVNVVAIVVPIVFVLVVVAVIIIAVVVIVWCVVGRRRSKRHEVALQRSQSQHEATKQKLEKEREKVRKASMTELADGNLSVTVPSGKLLERMKSKMSPSHSVQSDIETTPTTPPPEAAGGPPLPTEALKVPEVESTGSTGSYSPPRVKRPHMKRSFSEGAAADNEPLLERRIVNLVINKDSVEIKVKQDQLMEELRKRRNKSKTKLKGRSKSISTDSTAHKEESAPLLMTLSEIQFSSDLLHAISEEELPTLGEESGTFGDQEGTGYTNPAVNFVMGTPPSTPPQPTKRNGSDLKVKIAGGLEPQEETTV